MQNNVLQISINGIKAGFVKYDYNLIEDVKSEEGIKYLGKKDISAMKLMAVANKGDQALNKPVHEIFLNYAVSPPGKKLQDGEFG